MNQSRTQKRSYKREFLAYYGLSPVSMLLLVAVFLVILVLPWALKSAHLHFIREDGGGGTVLWNTSEAYFFMYDCPAGFIFTLPEYLAEPINEQFYAPAFPADGKCTLTVLHVTSAGVDRHSQDFVASLDLFTPIDGSIYAHCAGGTCRWDGSTFKLITEDEERRAGGYDRLSKEDFTNVDGWSKRGIPGTYVGQIKPPFKLSLRVNSSMTLSVNGSNPVSVELQRSDGARERIWYHEQHTHLVSAAAYKRMFATH
jgi:hypothetical protein